MIDDKEEMVGRVNPTLDFPLPQKFLKVIIKELNITDTTHQDVRNNLQDHLKFCTVYCNSKSHFKNRCDIKRLKQMEVTREVAVATPNMYTCNFCKKKFSKSDYLQKHERRHSQQKNFKCKECKKCFLALSSLEAHKKLHTGEELYKCHECHKSYLYRCDLTRHLKKHTGSDDKVECDVCFKHFTKLTDLRRHKKIHGDAPFQCSECLKPFVRLDHFEAHKRTHTGEKPFQCSVCKKSFSRNGSMKRHQLLWHKDKN